MATVPDNGTATVCFYEQPVVTPTPTPTPAPQGNVTGVTYLCDNGSQTATPAPGTITIGSVSGTSPQTASGLTSGSHQGVTAQAGSGYELVACGGTEQVTPPCTVTGNAGGQGMAIVPENGTATVCFYEQPVVVTPPTAPVLSIVKHVDQTRVVAPAPLTYTIEVSNTGDAAATNVGIVDHITPGTVQFDGPTAFYPSSGTVRTSNGSYIWAIPSIPAGGHADLVFTIVARTAGTIDNASVIGVPQDTCAAPTCSQVETIVTQPASATVTAVIYKEGTTQVVPGGTVQLQGVTQPTHNYPATYGNLPAGSYCVQESNPAGWSLVGATVSGSATGMTTPGQVCFPLAAGQTVPVVYYVNQPATPTACVGEEYMLQGTHIVIPGGTVSLTGQPDSSTTPATYCNLAVGSSVTGAPGVIPTGYQLVAGTQPITETLVAGNNQEMIFYLNVPQAQPQCGEVIGTIVLVGTHTMVPGGTITEGGQTVTAYPSLLGGCQPAGVQPVTATVPPGYTFVGPGSTHVTIVNGEVTPVVFQVTPLAGGVQGVSTPPAGGVQAAATQHAPVSGVLGTSIGMPLTGAQAAQRLALSLVCLTIGLLMVAMTVRGRRAA
jgi:uncharacterized repeat protein (TIGR01451 family)